MWSFADIIFQIDIKFTNFIMHLPFANIDIMQALTRMFRMYIYLHLCSIISNMKRPMVSTSSHSSNKG